MWVQHDDHFCCRWRGTVSLVPARLRVRGLDVTRLIRVVIDVSKSATHAVLDVLGPGGKLLLDARFVTFRSS